MKNKLLISTILGSLALVPVGTCLAGDSARSDHQVGARSWANFQTEFTKAFHAGDVATLERLKKTQDGFSNINDLGGEFTKYGAAMTKWKNLIADAKKNAGHHHAGSLPWDDFRAAFTKAFHAGDVATLERLKANQDGFGNINDLGGEFTKYGAAMTKWKNLIADAKKNAGSQHAGSLPWADFRAAFTKAFHAGDVATLERLKANQDGFGNINDLGGEFTKYGAAMTKWKNLIADAKKNAGHHHAGSLPWEDFRATFTKAFRAGAVAVLEHLKSTQDGFGNINDLGGEFLKYGSGMTNWSKLIADAKKNES